MTQPCRVAVGGLIDRGKPVDFSFDGRTYQGFAGDTLASALLANNVHLVARSFKYHRPRGILSAGSEEPNALVTIDRGAGRVTPNLRATQVELHAGLKATSQNCFPSLRFDLGALAGLATPLLATGFYYKTFMWPTSFWKRFYEPAIRRAAGLGPAPSRPDPDRYLQHYAHCDVLIVGAGAAGLAAALGASTTGARVMLCDEQAEMGGSLLHEPGVTIDGWPAPRWVREVIAAVGGSVTMLSRTTAFGWYPDNMIGLLQRLTDHLAEPAAGLPRERLWLVRAGKVVLATGAIERPMVFPGNDRPGVMLAGAARTYLHRYGVKVGNQVVVATADDTAYRAAIDLRAAGVAITAIVDQRPRPDSEAVQTARALGIPVHAGMTIGGTAGRRRVHSAKLSNGTTILSCDTILMSGGWTPSVHLFSQSRRKLLFDSGSGTYLPSEGSVGACAGEFDLATSLRDGAAAGGSRPRSFTVAGLPTMAPPTPPVPATSNPAAFVDFQNDVTARDLAVATEEGFVSIEHVKRYTTTGMATDQGKTSNLNALTTVAARTGQAVAALGLTTFRPPYTPVTFGAFAGPFRAALYAPERRPPIAVPQAVEEAVGSWKRARCFPRAGETIDAAVTRECAAVRNDAAMLDASTLGKIEVMGPDAARFLSRIYTRDVTNLSPGRCRYALLLGEDGFIRDDGIIARLAPDRFHVTTTTAGAEFVLHHMEDYLQTEFSELRVWLTAVTEQWAVIAVQGKRSAEVLAPLVQHIDLATMPHMSVQQGHMGEIPIRLFRVSFTGETGFEVNLPPGSAQHVWNTLLQCGVTPYGTDAMQVLRAEKGYILVGQETDGTVTPDDVGLARIVGGPDFVGKRSLSLPDLTRPDRKQLVGLLPVDPTVLLEAGAPLSLPPPALFHRPAQHQAGGVSSANGSAIGHVTSSYRSSTLGRAFSLALVARGRSRIGSKLVVSMPRRAIEVVVTEPVFLDKPGERLRLQAVSGLALAAAPTPAPTQAPIAATKPTAPAPDDPTRVARACGSVELTVLPPTIRLSIRAGPAASTAIGLALGVLLPTAPCRSVTTRDRAALWLGPDEWLFAARSQETASDLAVQATEAAGQHPASVVDLSHRSRTLLVEGSQAAWCLNAFCALDLDLHAFPVGMCTRTLLGKAEVVLWRIAPEAFQIDVARSLLPAVWASLEEARLEFAESDAVPSR